MKDLEQLIDLYQKGYNSILDELKESQDDLMDIIRTKRIQDLMITIKFEACTVPTYEVKCTCLPEGIFDDIFPNGKHD